MRKLGRDFTMPLELLSVQPPKATQFTSNSLKLISEVFCSIWSTLAQKYSKNLYLMFKNVYIHVDTYVFHLPFFIGRVSHKNRTTGPAMSILYTYKHLCFFYLVFKKGK